MAGKCYGAPQTARITSLALPARLVVIAAGVAALIYFPWRLGTFNPHALTLSFALFAAELFGLTAILLHTFMTWHQLERVAPEPPAGLTVDIFIPTYNEPIEMLRRTLLAARDMKYPHETWLLDDGRRPEMAELAASLGVHYLARPDNKHAKAGNLNYAFARSRGQFIAIFDADHVPHNDFLLKTLGYFNDGNVAFVQTPQDFYNLDSFQHRRSTEGRTVWTEQSLFFRVIMPGKDYWNAAFFCGSCAIARRAAIANIGGFATETITEDLHTSIRLHKKGYSSVYHAESLAFGLAPDTFEPYESQRVRWGQGAMQVWRLEGMLTARGLTWQQRLCYFASVLTYFDGWQKAFMYLLPSFVLVTGIVPVKTLDWSFLAYLLPWWLLSLWTCEELGRGYARSWIIEQYNFLRYPGFVFATLTLFLNRKLKFRVTDKGGSRAIDNLRRMTPHLAVILLAVAATLIGLIRYAHHAYMPSSAFIFNLIWVCGVTTVAIAATLFAVGRSKQERTAYRFRLPLPMMIRWPGQKPRLVATEDVSSSGFRLLQQDDIRPGVRGEAQLILPSGRSQVEIEVRRTWALASGNSLALTFEWPSKAAADVLESYLYGSNTEWLLNDIQERSPTPTERIRKFFAPNLARSRLLEKNWRAVTVLPSDLAYSSVRLACFGSEGAELALPFPDTSGKIALIVPGEIAGIRQYRIVGMEAYKANDRNVYVHRLIPISFSEDEAVEWWSESPRALSTVA